MKKDGTFLPVQGQVVLEDAVGVRITELPITPEKVLRALHQKT